MGSFAQKRGREARKREVIQAARRRPNEASQAPTGFQLGAIRSIPFFPILLHSRFSSKIGLK